MAFKLDYYPDSVAGAFGKPAGAKGICSYHLPELEKITRKIGDFENVLLITGNSEQSRADFNNINGIVRVYSKPYHISLQADSQKELSDLAFQLSEQLANAGHPYYSLPYDHSQVEEVKEAA